jgi:DNA-binding XRE family transcriptional regulator
MIERGMKKIELAKALHVNEKQLYSVMSGGLINETIAKKICEYFGIER